MISTDLKPYNAIAENASWQRGSSPVQKIPINQNRRLNPPVLFLLKLKYNVPMDEIQQLARQILEDSLVMNLGTADESGPWVAPVTYVFDNDMNLYWLSMSSARHSEAISKNPKVACAIIADASVERERALQIEGTAALVQEVSLELEQKIQEKKGKPVPTNVSEVVPRKQIWYKLMPTRIELIHNEKFGYKRQRVK
jgi:nitroimidazol reductase NimA-like FMN-containing flavoprotein (pyridoxamine 5'-phosphate oxidase superfamily)